MLFSRIPGIGVIFYFILTLFFPVLTYSLDLSSMDSTRINTTEFSSKQNLKESKINNTEINKNDTAENIYVPIDKFLIADNQRYLINGSQPYLHTRINTVPTIIFSGITTGIFIIQHEMQQNTIWKNVGPFQVAEDGKYSAYLDKAGHFFGTFIPSYIFGELLMSSGFSWDDASILGGSLGLAYNTYVEILDGFSKDFGFSCTDWFADVMGSSFYVAQHYLPVLQNFTPKFMYVNPSWHHELRRDAAEVFIDNYSAQTFYMSVNVHNLLPEDYKKYWPSFFELSFGYAVYSLSSGKTADHADLIYDDPHFGKVYGNRKFLVSLDYNLIKILPEGPGFWNWLRQGLNYVKLPSPTLEFGSTTKFFLVYPFFIDIGNIRL